MPAHARDSAQQGPPPAERDLAPRVSVIVPAFDEAETIAEVVQRVLSLDLDLEVIVVDDGSTDGTDEALDSLPADSRLVVHRLPANLGKGAAVRTGLALARGEWVVVQDADLELCPEELPLVLAPLFDGQSDAVYGSRFLRGRGEAPLLLYWANRALTLLTDLLYWSRLTDEAAGYKAFSRARWLELGLQSTGFELCPEITAKLLRRKARIAEVPVAYRPRSKGHGKKLRALRDGLRAVWTLLKWRVLPLGSGGEEAGAEPERALADSVVPPARSPAEAER